MGGFSGLGGLLGETAPQDTGAFQQGLYGRKDPRRKEQFLGDIYSSEGLSALQRGGKLLEQPINYFSKLLSGDRQSMLSAVAPEVNSIVGQYDTAKRAAAQFSPRGGGRIQQLENLPYQQQGQITGLLEQVRPEAAQALTKISGMLQQLGIDESALGASEIRSASAEKDYQEQQRWQHGWGIAKLLLGIGGSLIPGKAGAAAGAASESI